ncbi:hypothetical protein EPUS_08273 [Endocarpon pusillum Z07020]|uniref:Uncharacterized protein n=1 Tax=Endocarpon pusillum (strain Z07020 / HMAS-L-300199) TaxID=1263415 RepID=U1I235_ENDPU|nr:uncharacterized protein EPUS_08273 [Endocarpon pusillum Z07020]ERF76019.1 hypothetical protein EPUS_08273 [Endocarpon pusillum Z07020]
MPRAFFSTKLFKKSSHAPSHAFSANKQSALSSLQKLKESCKTRVHTLKASLHSRTTTPQLVGKDEAASEFDISQCLPMVDDIGADLGLTFSHHEVRQSSTPSSSPSEGSQVEHIPPESFQLLPFPANDSHIHVRSSITITYNLQDDSQEMLVPQCPFTDVKYGSTTASVTATPQSASLRPSTDETNEPGPSMGPAAVSKPHNIIIYPSRSSCGENNDGSVLLDPADQTLSSPESDNDTSISDILKKDVRAARQATYDVPRAAGAQQALLDLAGIYADTGDSQADRKVVSISKNCENEFGDELASSNQEIELWMVESECLSLTKPDYVGRTGTSDNADHASPQTASKLHEHRKSPSGWVSRLQLKILQLQQENQELEAKIELFEENKEPTRQVNEREIGELSAENNRLSLRNSSLYYKFRRAQEALAEERRKGKTAKGSRDANSLLCI